MQLTSSLPALTNIRKTIEDAYRVDEKAHVDMLLDAASLSDSQFQQIEKRASDLVAHVREERAKETGIDSFMHQYSLSSDEGIALMCLAEALLRVPDKATIDDLIKDKLSGTDWSNQLDKNQSMFVNAATWGLMLTGRIYSPSKENQSGWKTVLKKFVGRASEGVVRTAVAKAMQIMSRQFVMGQNIKAAITRAEELEEKGYRYSYDMLGEAAITEDCAVRYFNAYMQAIEDIGEASGRRDVYQSPGVSVKLSALYARYEVAHYESALSVLSERLLKLCQKAKDYDIALTVDAEEADRLDLSLDIMAKVLRDSTIAGWQGFGLALQSYQKRAFYVLDWVQQIAKETNHRVMVRLIKGAYWDTEIKRAQMDGLKAYPVFTDKSFTDVSFQACAKKILTMTDVIYPQFATHNAYSVALILELAGEYTDFEFQCLHGMGQELYSAITPADKLNIPCRIYAPVGNYEDLLPYLVRRLLENGANSSFVNRIADSKQPIKKLVTSPLIQAKEQLSQINQKIPLPKHIFEGRDNAAGIDISSYSRLQQLETATASALSKQIKATSLIANHTPSKNLTPCYSPTDNSLEIGRAAFAEKEDVTHAFSEASAAFNAWSSLPVDARAACLERIATLLEDNSEKLIARLMQEAGKTLNDGIAEVREAVDFCRYYAKEAKEKLASAIQFSGYTGESNTLGYHGRGVMVCISPWNFPLAIFLGQITACLAAGNCVIAKPAEQTPQIAYEAIKLCYEAGVPKEVLQLVLGDGEVGKAIVEHQAVSGVLFTGSTVTAQHINRALANKNGPIVPLIAETGGQNAMIVGSSALLEQVVGDVITSSFGSAGQRCSALRVVYVQKDVYLRFIALLKGAMAMLKVASPFELTTDVGPVIDEEAKRGLEAHIEQMHKDAKLIYQCDVASDVKAKGHFVTPSAFEISSIRDLSKEQFGPILHVIPFDRSELDTIIDDINSTGFGLTMGIHSRIDEFAQDIAERVHAGNCYINRNMTGAVVGLQPFGGEGLSGTGPKAGGPNYLLRLCHERVITVDTTAAGGNASLMSL